jgi:Ca2+-binding EF-hand superfamily protein
MYIPPRIEEDLMEAESSAIYNNKIDSEHHNAHNETQDPLHESIRAIFDEIDTNKSNYISIQEVLDYILKNGYPISKKEIIRIYDGIDIDSSGLISFTEFFAFMKSLNNFTQGSKDRDEIVIRLFH